jgi:hypothetical protein
VTIIIIIILLNALCLPQPQQVKPAFVPIDYLLIPARAETFQQALDSLRYLDKFLSLLSFQADRVKNYLFFKVGMMMIMMMMVMVMGW